MAKKAKKGLIGKYVVVRAYAAGVHSGILVSQDGAQAELRDSRRLWRWWSRFSLSELADEGVRKDKVGECRFSAPTEATWMMRDWCEIRPCTKEAERSIREVANANT